MTHKEILNKNIRISKSDIWFDIVLSILFGYASFSSWFFKNHPWYITCFFGIVSVILVVMLVFDVKKMNELLYEIKLTTEED